MFLWIICIFCFENSMWGTLNITSWSLGPLTNTKKYKQLLGNNLGHVRNSNKSLEPYFKHAWNIPNTSQTHRANVLLFHTLLAYRGQMERAGRKWPAQSRRHYALSFLTEIDKTHSSYEKNLCETWYMTTWHVEINQVVIWWSLVTSPCDL